MQTKVKYFDKCVIISPVLPFLLSVSELGSHSDTLSVLAVGKKDVCLWCEKQKITRREQMQGDEGMFPSTITVFYDLIKDKTQTSRPENRCDVHV